MAAMAISDPRHESIIRQYSIVVPRLRLKRERRGLNPATGTVTFSSLLA